MERLRSGIQERVGEVITSDNVIHFFHPNMTSDLLGKPRLQHFAQAWKESKGPNDEIVLNEV
jgi:hypothetical protein